MKARQLQLRLAMLLTGILMATALPAQNWGWGQQVKEQSFQAGGYLKFQAYFNWNFVWINAGVGEFFIDTTDYYGTKTWKITLKGRTHAKYDDMFKQRHSYESLVDFYNLKPYRYTRQNYEDGYQVRNVYYWDQWAHKIYSTTWNSKKDRTDHDTIKYKNNVTDLVSGLFGFMSEDLSNMKKDEKLYLDVMLDSDIYNIYLRYIGKEKVRTRNREEFNCVKFSVLLVEGSMFDGGENLFVWVTDDKNHVPVYIEVPILVGNVRIYLDEYKGLKHPLTSKVK